MAAKKVKIKAESGDGFKVACKAGNHTVKINQPIAMGGKQAQQFLRNKQV